MAASRRAASGRADPDRILDAAMTLAAERRWRDVSLGDVAGAARVSLADLRAAYRSKAAILAALGDKAAAAVLAGGDDEAAGEPPRDRLLDALMRRFEALSAYRQAISSIVRDVGGDPVAAFCAGGRLMRSMAWTLEAAGISSAGPCGRLRIKGLAAVYGAAFFVWLRDDSPDAGRTLACLDRGLRRAERLALLLGVVPRRVAPDAAG